MQSYDINTNFGPKKCTLYIGLKKRKKAVKVLVATNVALVMFIHNTHARYLLGLAIPECCHMAPRAPGSAAKYCGNATITLRITYVSDCSNLPLHIKSRSVESCYHKK